jgi:CheY-like chemotaxis protein
MKVLIIDDDDMAANIWTIALQQAGFSVIRSANGKDGIDTAKKELPDIILLDQIMPDMKGNDVLQNLKADVQTKNIPIALVSNYSESNLMEEAIKQGAVDYILKYQVEPNDLVQKVQQLVQESKAVQQ